MRCASFTRRFTSVPWSHNPRTASHQCQSRTRHKDGSKTRFDDITFTGYVGQANVSSFCISNWRRFCAVTSMLAFVDLVVHYVVDSRGLWQTHTRNWTYIYTRMTQMRLSVIDFQTLPSTVSSACFFCRISSPTFALCLLHWSAKNNKLKGKCISWSGN